MAHGLQVRKYNMFIFGYLIEGSFGDGGRLVSAKIVKNSKTLEILTNEMLCFWYLLRRKSGFRNRWPQLFTYWRHYVFDFNISIFICFHSALIKPYLIMNLTVYNCCSLFFPTLRLRNLPTSVTEQQMRMNPT